MADDLFDLGGESQIEHVLCVVNGQLALLRSC